MIACDLPGCSGGLRSSGDICSFCAGRGFFSVRGLARLLDVTPAFLRRVLDPAASVTPEALAVLLGRILELQSLARLALLPSEDEEVPGTAPLTSAEVPGTAPLTSAEVA